MTYEIANVIFVIVLIALGFLKLYELLEKLWFKIKRKMGWYW